MLAIGGVAFAQLAGTSPSELYEAGVKARLEQRFGDAVDILRRVVDVQPNNSDALVQLGLALLATGDLDDAGDAFNKVLQLAPDYADARIGLARIAYRKGELVEARSILEPVTAGQPGNQEAAELLDSIGKAELAAAEAIRPPPRPAPRKPAASQKQTSGKQAKPDQTDAQMARARQLRTAGRFGEAEAIYRVVVKRHPRNIDALVALGLTVGFQQRFDEAAVLYDQALAIDPDFVDARLAQVRLALWRGEPAEARRLLAAAEPLVASNAEADGLDARLDLIEDRPELAQAKFGKLAADDPQNAEALAGLGDAQRAQGNEAAAREAWRLALAVDPNSADIQERLNSKPPPRWRFDLGSEVSQLTGGRGSWTDSSVGLSYRLDPKTALGARARLATRGSTRDLQLEARMDRSFTNRLSAYGLLAATPSADFLADASVGVGASWEAFAATGAIGPVFFNVDARYDAYAGADVWTVAPWVKLHLIEGRMALSARWIHTQDTDGARADGYSLRLDVSPAERLRLHAGYTDAPEISGGALTPTRTVFGGIEVDLTDRLALHGEYAHEERPTFDRDTFGLGLSVRF